MKMLMTLCAVLLSFASSISMAETVAKCGTYEVNRAVQSISKGIGSIANIALRSTESYDELYILNVDDYSKAPLLDMRFSDSELRRSNYKSQVFAGDFYTKDDGALSTGARLFETTGDVLTLEIWRGSVVEKTLTCVISK